LALSSIRLVTNGAAGQGAPQANPGKAADSAPANPGKAKRGGRKRGFRFGRGQWIGAAATIVAAIIGGLFLLLSGGGGQNGGLQLTILNVSYAKLNGGLVISVRGTVHDLGAGEHVYAFAGRHADLPPWYPGGPASVSGSGLWTAEIMGLPASGGYFSVWAGLASPPSACQGLGCRAVAYGRQKRELARAGPHAFVLTRVTHPRHLALPRS
jgi:hypothetical protein